MKSIRPTGYLAIFLLFGCAGCLFGANKSSPAASSLFVSSSPFGAIVVLDGRTRAETTPLIVRNLRAGRHKLTIAKAGYGAVTVSVNVTPGAASAVEESLPGELVGPIFPDGQKLSFRGKLYSYQSSYYEIPAGSYEISRSADTVAIKPIFPGQTLLTAFNVVTPTFLVAAGAAAVSQVFTYQNSDVSSLVIFSGLTLVSAMLDISLHIQKGRYMRAMTITPVPLDERDEGALYAKANDLLSRGDLAGATQQYVDIVRGSRDSIYYPMALYQLGRIGMIQGDTMLAASELRIIVDRYPVPELYDRACKALADIDYEQGDYKSALGYLDKMAFLDKLYTRAEIDQYRAAIQAKMR